MKKFKAMRNTSAILATLFIGLIATISTMFVVETFQHFTALTEHATGLIMAVPVFAGMAGGQWEALKARILSKFPDVNPAKVQRSTLRAELIIANNQSNYVFTFANRAVNFVAERILDKNDVFVGGQIGMFLAGVETAKEPAYDLLTYPNPTVLATNAGATQDDFSLFYNGKATIQTGTDITRPILTQLFYNAQRTQQSSATTRDSKQQYDGYLWMPQAPLFSGSADQNVTVGVNTFATTDVAATTTGWTTRLIVCIDGFNIYNAATYGSVAAQAAKGYLETN